MVPSADNRSNAESPTPTLLVVEDEALIRMDLADILRHEGFNVIEAAGPAEARDALSSGAPITFVLTDLHMPQRDDGIGLLQWIGREYPNLPVLAASGVSDSLELAHKQGARIVAAFEKPYRPHAIVAAVRAVQAGEDGQS